MARILDSGKGSWRGCNRFLFRVNECLGEYWSCRSDLIIVSLPGPRLDSIAPQANQMHALKRKVLSWGSVYQVVRVVLLATWCLARPTVACAAEGPQELLDLVTNAEQKAQDLGRKLEQCRQVGQDIAYPDATRAVAELFCRFSRYDATQRNLRESATRSMEYVLRMLEAELRQADEVLAGHAQYPAIPAWRSAIGTSWHDGSFWNGGEPLFLSGFNWDAAEAREHPALLKRLGVNLVDGMFQGTMRSNGLFDDPGFKSGQQTYLRQMTDCGLAVDCLWGVGLPQWLFETTPGLSCRGYGNDVDYVLEHPQAVTYREQVLDHFIPLYAAEPACFAIDLANEPAFQGPSELMFEHWRTWLKRKYGDVAALNQAWGTHLASLAAVDHFPSQPKVMKDQWERASVDFSQPGARGMHYDWCAFNNERISDYFGSVSARIRARAPRVATHVKVMLGNYFTGSTEERGWRMALSYHTFGLDLEALAQSCSLLGGDVDFLDLSEQPKPNRRYGSVPYIMGWLDADLAADLLKSLAPDKPFYDSEFHITRDDQVVTSASAAKAHIETALWLAHLHGMSANLAWYWSRDAEGRIAGAEWFKGSLLQQPWMLQGYAQETLSLRRFVREVETFAQEVRPVRLLYSEASAIQDVGYLDTLRDAYEALNFMGASIGIVTERQLAEHGLPARTRLLIVPNAQYLEEQTVEALRRARHEGLSIGIIGERSLTAVPTGGRRTDPRIPGADTILVGTPQEYQGEFGAWFKSAHIEPELVALDKNGTPAWGIEVRTAHLGARRFAYAVNLVRDPVKINLRWRRGTGRWRDWRTQTDVPTELTLGPRQLLFGPIE